MNKTVTVNIGGIVFHIDENAYERFKQYLESIRGHFTTSEGRDEIMQDIEARIAEMFQERIKDAKEVITLEDVSEVTNQMGKPEQFGDDQEPGPSVQTPPSTEKGSRRFFRNPDDKLLGGVCSGISQYFNIDPVWVRLGFVLTLILGFGFGFLLYIILWIIVPEAKTTAEKLQMRGEPVTIGNIERNVKEEMEQERNRTKDDGTKVKQREGTVIGRIFEAIGEVIKFIFILIGKIIAAFFMLIGVFVSLILFISLFALAGAPGTHFPPVLSLIFSSGTQFALAYIGVVLLVGIPFLMLAYAGARLLFNIKKSSRIVSLTALGLWLTGVGLCLVVGLRIAHEFSAKDSIRKEIALSQPPAKKMVLTSDRTHHKDKYYGWDDENFFSDDADLSIIHDRIMASNVKLDIVKSETDSFHLSEISFARGSSRKEAVENASHIDYSFMQSDTLIRFEHAFKISDKELYRGQRLQLVLQVPVGGVVYFDSSLRGLIYDIENLQNVLDRDMINRTWKMTEKGLTCLDCDGSESTLNDSGWNMNGKSGSNVKIDESGVHISGPDGEQVAIDSNGVVIQNNGEDVVRIQNKKGHKK